MRRWTIIAAGLLMLALAGCSVLRLAYSQADELSFWWLDGYVDFDDSQSPRVRDAIGRWFAWHRRTQLPDYAALLDRAATEVLQDTTPATACRWFADLRQRADAAVDQALPEAAAIAAGFSTDQLLHIERQQARNSAEFREDFLQPDPTERLARSVERATERAEQLYGRLGDRQRQRIAEGVRSSPFDAERWLAERQRRHRDLLNELRRLQGTDTNGGASTAGLRGYWQRVQRSPDDGYRRYQERLEAYNCDLSAQLHNLTTPAQRQEAQRRLRGWQSDLRRLAAP